MGIKPTESRLSWDYVWAWQQHKQQQQAGFELKIDMANVIHEQDPYMTVNTNNTILQGLIILVREEAYISK